jgi:acetyl esterase/lipase
MRTGSIRFAAPLLVVLALAVALLHPSARATDPDATRQFGVRVEKNVVYETVGGDKLQLDLAMPPGEGPFPCVVMLHGGAWRTGTRKEFSSNTKDKAGALQPSWIETVAQRGYVTATVDYRLAPKYQFPAMIEDASAAVRFLRAHAKTYHIDPNKVGVVGFSAGAHLALLLGLCDRSAGFDVGANLNESSKVQCVVDFFGPTDMSLYSWSPGIVDAFMVPFLGKDCKTNPEVYKRASPITYVTKNAPPILILHGTFDLIVPIIHSEKLYKALKEDGDTVEMITFPGQAHGGWDKPDMDKAISASYKFLDEHLKGKK